MRRSVDTRYSFAALGVTRLLSWQRSRRAGRPQDGAILSPAPNGRNQTVSTQPPPLCHCEEGDDSKESSTGRSNLTLALLFLTLPFFVLNCPHLSLRGRGRFKGIVHWTKQSLLLLTSSISDLPCSLFSPPVRAFSQRYLSHGGGDCFVQAEHESCSAFLAMTRGASFRIAHGKSKRAAGYVFPATGSEKQTYQRTALASFPMQMDGLSIGASIVVA